ncbi:MAG: ThuA domain-containing protein, partial [Mucilaginibacter sp.]
MDDLNRFKRLISPALALVFIFLIAFNCVASVNTKPGKKILVFGKTAGFHHASIPLGMKAIQQLGTENKFSVDTTTDSKKFTTANLAQYAAVIFLSTTGDVLDNEQQRAFESYIKGGGGFVGVHAATDTEYDW